MVVLILLVLAFACFLLAAFGTSSPKVQLFPLGAAFVVAALIYPQVA
jgi:hypothetical protein